MKKREIQADDYYALLCNCGFDRFKTAMVCAIFSTKKEAQDLMDDKDLKLCVAKHKIVKCDVVIHLGKR